jgi:hypothetical protein
MILFFSSFIQTEFSLFTDSFTTIAPTNDLWSIFLIYKDICDQILVYILICGSIVSDFIITHIYSIIVIINISGMILLSGPTRNLGKKLLGVISGAATVGSVYTGSKEIGKDVKSLFDKGPKTDDPSSKPSGSTPTDTKPSTSSTK